MLLKSTTVYSLASTNEFIIIINVAPHAQFKNFAPNAPEDHPLSSTLTASPQFKA
jgi:hypothetical protein